MNLIIQILMRQETKENAPEFKTLLRKINSFNPYKKTDESKYFESGKKGYWSCKKKLKTYSVQNSTKQNK